jgi:hypothetical protein
MPRNGAGTYSLPTGNPVSAGTIIEADWANDTMADVADALSDSLSRSGQGGMTAPFRLADGNAGAPGVAWLNETSTGLYRVGSGELGVSVLGTQIVRFTVNGVFIPTGRSLTVDSNATIGGTLGVTGAITASGGVVGNVTGTATNVSGVVAPANGGTGATAVPTNGQVLIGNGATYTAANLTAGAGISISNGAGSITLAAASSTGLPTLLVVSGTSQLAATGFNYALTNAAVTTVTLPASPAAGDVVWVTSANGRRDNVVARNGQNINGVAADMVLSNSATQLQYVDATYGWAELTQASGGVEPFVIQSFGIV